jgi:poly[(R)-3-hydroxyalkanoate] polymerase subunit PhaC
MSALDRVRREVERNALRARNGIKVAAGTARPALGQTPKDVVWRRGRAELWRYHSDDVRFQPPLLFIPSLFNRSYILDLRPGNSFMERLVGAGFDVYLLDWGVPDVSDAANTLEDYVDDYIPAAINVIRRQSGYDQINLMGYCFGGLLAVLHAAHHSDSPLRSLTVLTTPCDFHEFGALGDVMRRTRIDTESVLDEDGNLPARIISQGFKSLTPTADATRYVNLLEKLWSDEYVAADQAMGGWANDHVPLPGGVARQLSAWTDTNPLITDRVFLGGDRVHLADITLPFLHLTADRDHIVPEACSAPLLGLVGSQDKQQLRIDAGHVGLAVGKSAHKGSIPTIIEFLKQRSEAVAWTSSHSKAPTSTRSSASSVGSPTET